MNKIKNLRKLWMLSLIMCMLFGMRVSAATGDAEDVLEETQPKVMVESYEVSEGEMAIGQKFTLKLNLKNPNEYNDAYNLMVTFTSETDNVRLQDFASNQVFVEELLAGETTSVEFPLEVTEQFESDIMVLDVYLDCVDQEGEGYTLTSMITPKIAKNCELEINALSVAESAVVGAKSLVSVRYSNVGAVPIETVVMHLEGDIMDSPKDVELAGLDAGEQKYLDYYVNFLQEGSQNVDISFTYTDEEGTSYEVDAKDFQVNVTAFSPVVTSVTSDNDDTLVGKLMSMQSQNLLLYGILACAVVMALVLVAFILVTWKKNTRGGR